MKAKSGSGLFRLHPALVALAFSAGSCSGGPIQDGDPPPLSASTQAPTAEESAEDPAGDHATVDGPATRVMSVDRVWATVHGSLPATTTLCRNVVARAKMGAGLYRIESIDFDPDNASLPWSGGKISWMKAKRLASWTTAVEAPETFAVAVDGWVSESGKPEHFLITAAVGDEVGLAPQIMDGIPVVGPLNIFDEYKGAIDAQFRDYFTGHGATTFEEFGALVGELHDAIWPQVSSPDEHGPGLQCPFDYPLPDTPVDEDLPPLSEPVYIELGTDAGP